MLRSLTMSPSSTSFSRAVAWRLTYLLPVVALLCSCAAGRGSLDGRVVDEDRGGAAVPGAFVVITRHHDIFYSSNSAYEDQELAITNADGRFHFGRWSAPSAPAAMSSCQETIGF